MLNLVFRQRLFPIKLDRNVLKQILFRSAALMFGLVAAFAVGEIMLRILEPVPFRVRGMKIQPRKNVEFTIENGHSPKLDRTIIHTRNSIGFRGQEPLIAFDRHLTIVAVGGSTTECYYLSDGKTWADVLQRHLNEHFSTLWLNNAGLNGHSTFGHTVLVNDYLSAVRPKVALFLVGVNDVAQSESNTFEKYWWGLAQSADTQPAAPAGFIDDVMNKGLWNALAETSDLINLGLTVSRSVQALDHGLRHSQIDFAGATYREVPETVRRKILAKDREGNLALYEKRLRLLMQVTRRAHILPVLITQPALWGDATDPETGLELGKMGATMWGDAVNGSVCWQRLQQYNDVTRAVAADLNVHLVDAAVQMPKDSKLYYDYIHFTNAGAAELARVLGQGLRQYLSTEFPQHAERSARD